MSHAARFTDRHRAAADLGRELAAFRHHEPVVIGVPAGGVMIAERVADILGAELDVALVHRLLDPAHPTDVVGSTDLEGHVLLGSTAPESTRRAIGQEAWYQQKTLERWANLFRRRPRPSLAGRLVLIVDDVVITGSTLQGAVAWARRAGASPVVAAVPVATPAGMRIVNQVVDNAICLHVDPRLVRAADAYVSFTSLTEGDVLEAVRGFDRRRHDAAVRDAVPGLNPHQWWMD